VIPGVLPLIPPIPFGTSDAFWAWYGLYLLPFWSITCHILGTILPPPDAFYLFILPFIRSLTICSGRRLLPVFWRWVIPPASAVLPPAGGYPHHAVPFYHLGTVPATIGCTTCRWRDACWVFYHHSCSYTWEGGATITTSCHFLEYRSLGGTTCVPGGCFITCGVLDTFDYSLEVGYRYYTCSTVVSTADSATDLGGYLITVEHLYRWEHHR